jgi:hypothetical protein
MTWTEIPEVKVAGHGLGRHIDRTDDFEARKVGIQTAAITDKTWVRHCPPFNQGDIGSCTGNASAGALMTDPFWVPGRAYTERSAVYFYSQATHYNGTPNDYYPPNDTGSSGPAVAKALEADKLISNFNHAVDLETSLGAMMVVPGIFGVNWMTSFDTPLPTGECPLLPNATVRGGHEIQAFQVDVTNERVWFYQSWGATWGGLGNGTFWLSYNTLDSLFQEGADGTFFVPPVISPPVKPTPVVSPTPVVDPTPTPGPYGDNFLCRLTKFFGLK